MSPRARGLRSVSLPPEGPRSRRVHAAEPTCSRPPPRARAAPAHRETEGWPAARPCSRWLAGEACTTLNLVNARARQLLDELLQMSAKDRALIAAELGASLDEDSPEEVEKAWAQVIERRARVVLAGRSRGRDGFEVLDEIEARLRARR